MFKIENFEDLELLHRALLEAKFNNSPNDECIMGSKPLAKIICQITDILFEEYVKQDGEDRVSTFWNPWRKMSESRREWQLIKNEIKNIDTWEEFDDEAKKDYITILASPFIVDEAQIEILKNIKSPY